MDAKRAADVFGQIYDVLVELAGAPLSQKPDFVHNHVHDSGFCEWRFGGKLGFGGKFWRTGFDPYYVSCYPEDKTPDLQRIIDAVNEKLKGFPYIKGGA